MEAHLVAGSIRDVALAIFAQVFAIIIEHNDGVEEAVVAPFKKADRQHLPGSRSKVTSLDMTATDRTLAVTRRVYDGVGGDHTSGTPVELYLSCPPSAW